MSTAAFEVNHKIWSAVVGSSVKIPATNSHVYYFPQGHLENSSAVDYNYIGVPSIQCRVLSLCFLSTSSSDESFVKIYLRPLDAAELQYTNENDENVNNQTDIASFPKILTSSDVSAGGGFSVPKYCAEAIFPELDLSLNPPAQNLSIRDTHNNAWEFRHTYRGMPSRHLLTTGWSKFINDKRLVAGDTVVFMKRRLTEELFIGIRRNARIGGDETQRIQAAVAAIESAKKGKAFEVDYYPMFGFPNFLVSTARVERSMRIGWCSEMRVKMLVPSDDQRRVVWFEGRIESTNFQLPQSPWRMLEVNWDEVETHPNMKKVSPWDVECLSSSSHHISDLPPCKKSKLSQNPPEILPDHEGDQGEFSFPLLEPHLNSAASFNYPPFPPVVECDDSHHVPFTELLKRGVEEEPETISTALTLGSSNYERSSSTVEQGLHSSTADGRGSIMLFGKTIQTAEKPIEGGGSRNNGEFLRDVHPNSSPGFRNNSKGKNIVYE